MRWSGVSLSAPTTVGLGGMVPWSLDGGCVLRCARRAEALSSAVVALMVGSVRSFALVYHSRDGSAESSKYAYKALPRDCARKSACVVIAAQGPVFSLLRVY
jgi:hypothetical protein